MKTWDVYGYEKNIFGDIVAVYDKAGTKLISYKYDAFGNFTATTHVAGTTASNNPFRYRGYYYDIDLGLYYLNSRYYDSNTGRFISADNIDVICATPGGLTDKNLFSYCDNNFVMYKQSAISSNGSVDVLSVTTASSSVSAGAYSSVGGSPGVSGYAIALKWKNGDFQIPIWISSLMSGADFGASVAPALRTMYQYIRYPGIKDLNKLYGLDFVPGKLNNVCSTIGYGLIGLNIGFSAWSNFTNYNLTIKQQWISFGVDTIYTLGSFGIGCGVGAMVSSIPVVGVYVAPFVSAGVVWFIEWTNEKWGWLNDVKEWINNR